ncbi:hypothetical protein ASPWEDRAFT_491064 [Aspergillus wentii DTO 134E9]|uniref:Secreted protein n=1 Tax=Aspergillus wentii DTO 134E9 TaxID=1073089 RepID=A0A1L9RJL9_ASPWE|nr:uncharacterized protein ASPWEDRAFT_491064 [Aspergillus wentii DTO 134E9]OJJ35091.1 hypothetical protein ASPWEDRAFT_491064 [Aspergillus wentii DTO 134E9]
MRNAAILAGVILLSLRLSCFHHEARIFLLLFSRSDGQSLSKRVRTISIEGWNSRIRLRGTFFSLVATDTIKTNKSNIPIQALISCFLFPVEYVQLNSVSRGMIEYPKYGLTGTIHGSGGMNIGRKVNHNK